MGWGKAAEGGPGRAFVFFMDSAEELEDAFLEMEQEAMVAGEFTWAEKDYPCLASSRGQTKKLGEGGYSMDADLTILVRVDLFDEATPALKQRLEFEGRKYLIEDLRRPQVGTFIKLLCNDPNRGL